MKDFIKCFDETACTVVNETVVEKRRLSTFQLCNAFVYKDCINCDACSCWYHYTCAKVSNYHKSSKSKKWICSKYRKPSPN